MADQLEPIEAVFGESANTFGFLAAVEIDARQGEGSERIPTFEIVAYNGGPLATPAYMQKFGMPVVIDLRGLENAQSITANMDHDQAQRVGHISEVKNDGRRLILAGIVSGTGPAASEVVENSKRGYPWQASVEAVPLVPLEKIEAGKSEVINGQRIAGPVLVARRARLHGVAFLARGADQTTSVSIAATAAETTIPKGNKMTFADWIIALGLDESALTDVQRQKLTAKYNEEIKAAGGVDNGKAPEIKAAFDLDELKVAYAKFEAEIEATAFEFSDRVQPHKMAELKSKATQTAIALKRKALQEEWAATRFEVEAIRAGSDFKVACLREDRPAGPAIHSGRGSADINGEVIEAALATSPAMQIKDAEKGYSDKTLQTAHSLFKGRVSLHQVMILAASANGYQPMAGERIHVGNLREVLRYSFASPMIQASASVVSLSGILSNIANKVLLQGFFEVGDEWKQISEVRPVSDFKTVTSYRLLDNMEYEKIGANGEIPHGQVSEESFTRSADTYAKMFSLTRQQIINDDLGAFDDIRTRLGAGAARAMRRLFWQTFMDNASFFTSGRGNYISGSTSNLGTDGVGLQLGITAYRKLKSTDKKQVGSTSNNIPGGPIGPPSLVVVPPEVEFNAEKLYTSSNLSTVQDDNIHRGKYRPIVVNELSDTGYTGNSTTAWYLFGALLKPMVVSVLNGVETPTIESAEADFNSLGVQFRGYHDFGCDKAEWLAGIKSKGAA